MTGIDGHPFLGELELTAGAGPDAAVPQVLFCENETNTKRLFGSDWRGPLWFPLNYLVISALERYHRFFGDQFTIEYPTGSGQLLTLDKVATDLQDRLISIFTRGPGGRRPCRTDLGSPIGDRLNAPGCASHGQRDPGRRAPDRADGLT